MTGAGGFGGGASPVSASQLASASAISGPKSNAFASPRSSRCRARSASVAASSPSTTP